MLRRIWIVVACAGMSVLSCFDTHAQCNRGGGQGGGTTAFAGMGQLAGLGTQSAGFGRQSPQQALMQQAYMMQQARMQYAMLQQQQLYQANLAAAKQQKLEARAQQLAARRDAVKQKKSTGSETRRRATASSRSANSSSPPVFALSAT